MPATAECYPYARYGESVESVIAQIEGLLAGVHPAGQSHARPAGGLDPDRVEARRDPDIVHLGREAQVIGIVGGEAFRPVEKRVDPGLGEHGHPVDRRL